MEALFVSLFWAVVVLSCVVWIREEVVNSPQCPTCGGRETHKDEDATYWLRRQRYFCECCEAGFEKED